MAKRCYFDWAATAIPDVKVSKVPWGNPSSLYHEGRLAKNALEHARTRCAAALNVSPDRLYFCAGATEANGIVLSSFLLRPSHAPMLYSAVEHSSIRENGALLARLGKQMSPITVGYDGRVSRADLAHAFEKNPHARFAALMAVNNEVGSIMDMQDLTDYIRKEPGAPVHIHSDLVQAVGKIPLDITGWDLDSAVISAHKIGGPRGIGLLYLKKPLEAFLRGGGQERGIRPGTENTAGALALAECLERRMNPETFHHTFEQASERCARLIDFLKTLPRCRLIPEDRQPQDSRFSPYIIQAAFDDIPGEVLVRALDDAGIAVSTGSACSVGTQDRPVLTAMGLDTRIRLEGIRISQGWSTTMEDIDRLCSAVVDQFQFL
ncbi:aminotransferase V [Spirochaetia bacterium]|nr:aminotransferase V [Spirochaetia bacterium]